MLLDHLLTGAPGGDPLDSVAAAWSAHRLVTARCADTIDAAVLGGWAADRLGYAFVAGYQEALRALLPGLPSAALVSLAATEAGGAHPAVIETALRPRGDGWTVSGTKTFATLGTEADVLVVVASAGPGADGRNTVRTAMVDPRGPGVRAEPLPPTPFAPEIPHAVLTLTDAPAVPLLGDGYADHLKPFRTFEDAHVLAATLGQLVRVARQAGWPPAMVQRLLGAVAEVRGLGLGRPSGAPAVPAGPPDPVLAVAKSPAVHIALAGTLDLVDQLLAQIGSLWNSADPVVRERWERDRRLLNTAERVRALRTSAAWQAIARG
ncbi:acyl-CoA dehydrogenase family protein [Nocardia sp. NPDC057353]|uniref:acyl-CoA dehydrogenase family protein n=1 Tax=Nocardia sp. NPDC057353 TaxID=3346104 RepID=UPI003641E302